MHKEINVYITSKRMEIKYQELKKERPKILLHRNFKGNI